LSDPFIAGTGKGVSSSEDVRYDPMRRVAKYQRWVLFALLANIIVSVLFLTGVIGEDHPLELPVSIFSYLVALFSLSAIFMLARELLSTGLAVACAVLYIIPFVGLIVLLVINQKATKYLQRRGVRVGLMGADPNSI
jgi:hypothetical protein